MSRLALAAILVPTASLAHGGPEGHAHPHGLEGLAIVATAVLVGWFVWKAAR